MGEITQLNIFAGQHVCEKCLFKKACDRQPVGTEARCLWFVVWAIGAAPQPPHVKEWERWI